MLNHMYYESLTRKQVRFPNNYYYYYHVVQLYVEEEKDLDAKIIILTAEKAVHYLWCVYNDKNPHFLCTLHV